MSHLPLANPLPGIVGLMAYRPETGGPLSALAEALLRGPSPLTPMERELIAAIVSAENACAFCERSHAAAADALAGEPGLHARVKRDDASLSAKMRSLLALAKKVARSGRAVMAEDVLAARAAGASDVEIHDTVLIAAAFCMYNRYVDGLAAPTPDDPAAYAAMGERLSREGYLAGPGRPGAPPSSSGS